MEYHIELGAYFNKHSEQTEYRTVKGRTVNALRRGGIKTMDDLLSASEERLKWTNRGKKCLEMALYMRDKYAKEKANQNQVENMQEEIS